MTVNQNARLAGLLYAIVVSMGIVNLGYVPSQLIAWGDPALTVDNIRSSETLFRFGIYAGMLCYIAFLLLPFALYRLFEQTNRNVAMLMVIFVVVSVPVSIANLIKQLDVLTIIRSSSLLEVFAPEQINALVMDKLRSYNKGIALVQVFWGLWLFPLGYLVYKSGLIPKVLGLLLMLGCACYLVRFSSGILLPDLRLPGFVRLPATIAEIGTCLWLLLAGAKNFGNTHKREAA